MAVFAVALFSYWAWCADSAHAANPRSVPIGGRTATMGGAATAAGNDSAMPYLNPAGLAGLPDDVFAVSASLYGYSTRGFSGLFYPNGTPDTYRATRRDSTSVSASQVLDMPSSIMYVEHLPAPPDVKQVLGMCFVIPSRQRIEIEADARVALLDMAGNERQGISASIDYTDYYLGPSYAVSLVGDRVRLGVSVFALYTQWFQTVKFTSFSSYANDTMLDTLSTVSSRQARELSVVPIAGAQFQVAPSFWGGIAVAAPSMHLWGDLEESYQTDFLMPSATGQDIAKDVTSSKGVLRDQKPLRVNAGIAFDDREHLSVAADVHFYAARSKAYDLTGTDWRTSYRSGEIPRDVKADFRVTRDLTTAVDASLGAEFVVSRLLSLRLGGFTDLSNRPKIDINDTSPLQIREHRYGGTLGIGVRGGSFDSTLGVVYAHAAGDIATFDLSGKTSSALAAVATREDSILFVFSGQVTTQEAKSAIEKSSPIKVQVPGVSP